MGRSRSSIITIILAGSLTLCGCGSGATVPSTTAAWTTTTVSMNASSTATVRELPEGLQAVVGVTQLRSGVDYVWCVSADGVSIQDIPLVYSQVAVGELGSAVAYSDLFTGRLYLWRPGESPPEDLSVLELPVSGRAGDQMALSPDGRLLALVRTEWSEEAPDDPGDCVIRGYLIDLESAEVESWDWVESAIGADEVWTIMWDNTSSSVYVSFVPTGEGGGESRSYRYVLSSGTAVRLEGLALVYDVGSDGQVVGPALTSPFARPPKPLVLWREGERLVLPNDPGMFDPCLAWISDDGETIVVWGWGESDPYNPGGSPPLLEVLKLGEGGWAVSWLYSGDESLSGVAFEPNSDIFWFEAGSSGETGTTDVQLFKLDTGTNQVSASMRLPAGPGDYSQALAIVGAECSGGT